MKKLISLIIIFTMFLLVACGSESKSSNSESKSRNSGSESVEPDKESATKDVADSSSKEEKKEESTASVTIKCYQVPETEGRAFSADVEKKAEQIKADSQDCASIATIIKGIDNWRNDSTSNRLPMWIDAELSIEGDDASYYMAFEDGTLFRKNNDGLFVSKGDGKLTEIMDKICAGRYKDVERDANGLVTEEGAKKFALLCFLENYADIYLGHFGYEIDESFDGYDFKLEKDEDNKQITVTMKNHNINYKEFVFVIDCKKCCIIECATRDVEY